MIAILGAGLAGLSSAYHLKKDYRVLERDNEVGGLCKSVNIKGYVFDYAPHILFTRDPYTRQLYWDLLRDNILTQNREAYIYIQKTFIKYPFEVNLRNLPQNIIDECIQGVIDKDDVQPKNFHEWIYATFGAGIANHYMVPYNQKIWKYDLKKMNTDWIKGRVPSPSVEEMKRGAQEAPSKDYGLNAEFWYPKRGGIGSLATQLSKNLNISLNSDVIEIDPSEKGVTLTYKRDGEEKTLVADRLLTSAPLPELVKMTKDVPEEVVKASDSLIYNSIVCVNVGVKRPDIIDKHWLYFPEEDLIFNRISFPMNFSRYTTPEGRSSILVEVTYREKKLNLEETKDRVLLDLVKADIIKESDQVEVCDASTFKYAYVIYDLDHNNNVKIIRDHYNSLNVVPIGRFGEWEYFNMDQAIISGMKVAQKINEE